MGVPNWEKAPGIKEPWLGMWRYAKAAMQEAGTWLPHLRPMLDEMIDCRRLEREHRLLAEADPYQRNQQSDLTHMHDGFASARAYGKRAQEIATELGLTPKARRALADMAKRPEGHPVYVAIEQLARHSTRRRRTHAA